MDVAGCGDLEDGGGDNPECNADKRRWLKYAKHKTWSRNEKGWVTYGLFDMCYAGLYVEELTREVNAVMHAQDVEVEFAGRPVPRQPDRQIQLVADQSRPF